MRGAAAQVLGRLRMGQSNSFSLRGCSAFTARDQLRALVWIDARLAQTLLEQIAQRRRPPGWVDQLYTEALYRLGEHAAACAAAERALGH